MQRRYAPLLLTKILLLTALGVVGCGTTRSSDTGRTATEQLLISNAIDKAVEAVDMKALSGQKVFFDDSRLADAVDKNYLISAVRQQLLANGCLLCDRDKADFIVEARAGAVGTDRNDLLFGIPSTNVPQIVPMQTLPSAIPEIPIAKRRDQKGIVKIAVFAYHRETGTPVWQSGLVYQESTSNDVWILGAGPFQRGSIHEGTTFAGKQIKNDEADGELEEPRRLPAVAYSQGRIFTPPKKLVKPPEPETKAEEPALVAQADHEEKKGVEAPAVAPSPATPPVAASTAVAVEAPAASPPSPVPAPTPPAALPATAEAALPMPAASVPGVAAPAAEAKSVYLPAGTSALPQPRFDSR